MVRVTWNSENAFTYEKYIGIACYFEEVKITA